MDPLDKSTQGGYTALHVAANNGHLHVVQWLIEEGGMNPLDKSQKGETSLHVAARWGQLNITKWLIEEKGMDPMDKTSENGGGSVNSKTLSNPPTITI
ncbi:ankyrin repeat domain-containing protein 39-like [Mytilus californianus]|uniref:ankyrin repeat domain-containing protein 39-like n=1 Tax=Mytilus californianus TaxID=6549 RepID=UPI00224763E6|nr:ankyrin repeat domain-containing protein 39-like [Mytilus californianus]